MKHSNHNIHHKRNTHNSLTEINKKKKKTYNVKTDEKKNNNFMNTNILMVENKTNIFFV